ncbi:ATP synthase complex subunit H-domain-containing protein [Lipomyces kononenkoae]|uniref:ATP synthase complex subunit H-domain-containing protein n=1 Tax=Lipomyces kononenkoae TaxID=34357 RepID=A0ACC3SV70_LIPKO
MLAQSIRITSRACAPILRRRFGTSLPRRDIVQDLYLKEIKNYKAPPVKATDSVGQVKPWVVPSAPAPPAAEASAPTDLEDYESQVVEVEGVAAASEEEPQSDLDDWFVVEPIEDEHH